MAMSDAKSSGLTQKLKTGASSLIKKVKDSQVSAQLVKAQVIISDGTSNLYAPVTVQFNPSEYTISRSVKLSGKKPLGRDPAATPEQVVRGESARLSVRLYFDTITDLESFSLAGTAKLVKAGVPSAQTAKSLAQKQLLPGKNNDPATACDALMSLVKYAHEGHTPPTVRFLWGKLDFEGRVESSSVQYTMFSPDGTPVRAAVDLTLCGEESGLTQHQSQYPFQSPDRTKARTLAEGDRLWMMAQQEYDDPAKWKIIAKANKILNPRKVESAVSLKVPSIK